jgi:hypothetical protein
MSDGSMNDGPLRPDEIAAAVRAALGLGPNHPLTATEITRHTNINYVYRVTGPGVSVFVKRATSKLKAFDITAPRCRVAREAIHAAEFRRVCGHLLEIPRVVFLDERRFLVGLENVGEGREALHDASRVDYASCTRDGEVWGTALGTLARVTRVRGSVAPEDRPLSQAIWLCIMASGAARLFPEAIDGLLRPVSERTECLIHNDLWGKNILVGRDSRPAVLDFEGAGLGDPAVDVASLLATTLIPVLEDRAADSDRYARFVEQLAEAYVAAIGDGAWGREVLGRSYHLVSANLALRTVGISPYEMSPRAREITVLTAQALFRARPTDAADFVGAALRELRAGHPAPAPVHCC